MDKREKGEEDSEEEKNEDNLLEDTSILDKYKAAAQIVEGKWKDYLQKP